MEHIALMSKGGEEEDEDLVLSRNKHLYRTAKLPHLDLLTNNKLYVLTVD